jgi:hypothetical protein
VAGYWLPLAEMTERDTKGQKRTERDNIFEIFFFVSGAREPPPELQNALTEMIQMTEKHTKTHKCTVIFQLFFAMGVFDAVVLRRREERLM